MANSAPPPVDLTERPLGFLLDRAATALQNALLSGLRDLGGRPGVHVETLLGTIGVVAGHCAINAVWDAFVRKGLPPQTAGLVELGTKDSQRYYMGDALNRYLIPEQAITSTLWQNLARAAIEAGVPYDELVDFRELFRRVVNSIGTPEFGVLNLPAHRRPVWNVYDSLRLHWPLVRALLTRELRDAPKPPIGGDAEHWPLVANFAAGRLVFLAKDTIDPRESVPIVMEAAIAASKVDPESVPQDLPVGDES